MQSQYLSTYKIYPISSEKMLEMFKSKLINGLNLNYEIFIDEHNKSEIIENFKLFIIKKVDKKFDLESFEKIKENFLKLEPYILNKNHLLIQCLISNKPLVKLNFIKENEHIFKIDKEIFNYFVEHELFLPVNNNGDVFINSKNLSFKKEILSLKIKEFLLTIKEYLLFQSINKNNKNDMFDMGFDSLYSERLFKNDIDYYHSSLLSIIPKKLVQKLLNTDVGSNLANEEYIFENICVYIKNKNFIKGRHDPAGIKNMINYFINNFSFLPEKKNTLEKIIAHHKLDYLQISSLINKSKIIKRFIVNDSNDSPDLSFYYFKTDHISIGFFLKKIEKFSIEDKNLIISTLKRVINFIKKNNKQFLENNLNKNEEKCILEQSKEIVKIFSRNNSLIEQKDESYLEIFSNFINSIYRSTDLIF